MRVLLLSRQGGPDCRARRDVADSAGAWGCRDDGDPFHQLRFRQHAEADRRDLSGEGLGEVDGRDLGDLERGRNAVVAPRVREAGHRPAIDADRHHADAVACLERFQRRREGMAVGTVAAEEEEQHMVASQRTDRLAALGHLQLVEDLQCLGVDGAALQGRIQLGRGPGDALGDVGEGGGARHHLGLELHVATHVRFGRPHDGDVPGLLERLLQALELDDLGRLAGSGPRSGRG
jgi:hypothetical protein